MAHGRKFNLHTYLKLERKLAHQLNGIKTCLYGLKNSVYAWCVVSIT
jgi:hypothetical protein